jgi:hypothetical protein
MQIVLACVETVTVVTDSAGVDLGRRPKTKDVLKPVALMWLIQGTQADVAEAQAFADRAGYAVFTYDDGEPDPLERARGDALAKHSQPKFKIEEVDGDWRIRKPDGTLCKPKYKSQETAATALCVLQKHRTKKPLRDVNERIGLAKRVTR